MKHWNAESHLAQVQGSGRRDREPGVGAGTLVAGTGPRRMSGEWRVVGTGPAMSKAEVAAVSPGAGRATESRWRGWRCLGSPCWYLAPLAPWHQRPQGPKSWAPFQCPDGYGFIDRNDSQEDVLVPQTAIKRNNPKKFPRGAVLAMGGLWSVESRKERRVQKLLM